METIGQMLKAVRKQQGLTQKELSQDICSQSVLSRIENDEEIPNIMVTQQLCQRLGIKVDQLLDDHSESWSERQFCRLFFYLRQRQFQQLEERLNQLIPHVYLVSDRKRVALFQGICYYYRQQDPKKALQIIQDGLALVNEEDSVGWLESQVLLLTWAGKISLQTGAERAAENYFQQAYGLFQSQANWSERVELMQLFVSYGKYLYDRGRLLEAAQIITRGLSFSQRIQTYYQVQELHLLQQKLQPTAEND